MALTDKLTAIADAIRTKTGSTEKLTLAQMPTEIAAIQGGGSMETGEFVGTSSTFWAFTIPVSSKKTHLLVYPKSFADMWSQDTTSRERMLVAIDGIGHVQMSPGQQTDETAVNNGSSRWYFAGDSRNTVVFHDDSINVTLQYSPWAIGEYCWYAW